MVFLWYAVETGIAHCSNVQHSFENQHVQIHRFPEPWYHVVPKNPAVAFH
jgi:hypothetical protein